MRRGYIYCHIQNIFEVLLLETVLRLKGKDIKNVTLRCEDIYAIYRLGGPLSEF